MAGGQVWTWILASIDQIFAPKLPITNFEVWSFPQRTTKAKHWTTCATFSFPSLSLVLSVLRVPCREETGFSMSQGRATLARINISSKKTQQKQMPTSLITKNCDTSKQFPPPPPPLSSVGCILPSHTRTIWVKRDTWEDAGAPVSSSSLSL